MCKYSFTNITKYGEILQSKLGWVSNIFYTCWLGRKKWYSKLSENMSINIWGYLKYNKIKNMGIYLALSWNIIRYLEIYKIILFTILSNTTIGPIWHDMTWHDMTCLGFGRFFVFLCFVFCVLHVPVKMVVDYVGWIGSG